jgi:hypothetical protein
MARKPTDYVQLKLRIRESMRRKLERAAELRKHSANAEAVWRIERTFEQDQDMEDAAKEMEARQAELEGMARQHWEEQARLEAEHKAALRDSRLINMLAGSADSAALLRVILWYLQETEGWNSSEEKRIELANKIHGFLVGANDIFEGQTK